MELEIADFSWCCREQVSPRILCGLGLRFGVSVQANWLSVARTVERFAVCILGFGDLCFALQALGVDFRLRIRGYWFWVLGSGFWVLDFGSWFLGRGVLDFEFRVRCSLCESRLFPGVFWGFRVTGVPRS